MNRDMRRNYDGRNPYGSRGGYVSSRRPRRGRRGDRAMDNDYARRDYGRNAMRTGDYDDMARGRRDYEGNDMGVGRQYDMRNGYDRDMTDYGMDGHYNRGMQEYRPIEAMGYFNGYYGMPQDYARGDMRMDYGYDMRRGMDYGDYRDYGGYNDYGDYGSTLSEEELETWCKRLKSQLNEQEKQMFSKEMIKQKAKQMGKQMEGFGEKELETTVLMIYTDYKNTIGANVDVAIKLAFDWLNDKDVAVKNGAEKLAVYYDCIVEGE